MIENAQYNEHYMALTIKQAPTLSGDEAKKFRNEVAEAESKARTISFSTEVSIAQKILAKSNR